LIPTSVLTARPSYKEIADVELGMKLLLKDEEKLEDDSEVSVAATESTDKLSVEPLLVYKVVKLLTKDVVVVVRTGEHTVPKQELLSED